MRKALLLMIYIYQKTFSLDHGMLGKILPLRVCRHYPSCSEYARMAVEKFGALKGSAMAVRRVARCHPWGGEGYDPVPEAEERRKG